MAFDGSGNYVRIHNWTADAANSLDINAGEMDAEDNSIAGAFNNCITRDGQGKMAADFTPVTDNVYNLGLVNRRWATLNGVSIPTLIQGDGANAALAPYNADPTGVIDATASINAAIVAVAALGGGVVTCPPGTYKTSASLTLLNNVVISGYGATISYTGAGYAISTAATGTTNYPGVVGLTISTQSATGGHLSLASAYRGTFRDLRLVGVGGTTNVAILLATNTSGTANPVGNLNTAFNLFDNILIDCKVGTGVRLIGTDSNHITTDNSFVNFLLEGAGTGAVVYGIEFNQWCDSNAFSGMTLIRLDQTSPANGIGVAFGNGAGGGCYAETFQLLGIDCFGAPATDNRQGIICNNTQVKFINIDILEYGPVQGLGALPNISLLLSSVINQAPRSATNYQSYSLIGTNLGIGVTANVAATCFAQQGAWLSGASQYIYFAQGSCFNTASALGASYSATPGAAAAAGPYTVTQVMGFFAATGANGANATVTNGYGFFCNDQNFGATANFGFFSNMVAGAGKYAFYGGGSAASVLGGPLTASAIAIPAGGTAGQGLMLSSVANFGIFFGSGAPTLAAAKGSLYLRSDGSSTSTRSYINTDGGTTWTAITTVA